MFTKNKINASVSFAMLVALGLSNAAHGDPLPGEILKFQQTPLVNTPIAGAIYNGHDELSTAYLGVNSQGLTGWQGTFMADDFADKLSSPIVHLSWWGSYINNPNNTPVSQFLVSFESDVPGLPGTFSHPGTVLSSQIVNLARWRQALERIRNKSSAAARRSLPTNTTLNSISARRFPSRRIRCIGSRSLR